jgi:hypothetical protein
MVANRHYFYDKTLSRFNTPSGSINAVGLSLCQHYNLTYTAFEIFQSFFIFQKVNGKRGKKAQDNPEWKD